MSLKKRWPRISLRVFLVLFIFVAITVAWFARYANQRWAAFRAIRQAGGDIRMETAEPSYLEQWFGSELFGTVNDVDLREGTCDNTLLAHIGALNELRRLDLSNADVDDNGLRLIMHLPLEILWLQKTNITDASAETISNIVSLRQLQLNATLLSDTFLDKLRPLPRLTDLGLRGTCVTGIGMKSLERHPKLKELDVYSTHVNDLGVGQLVGCQSLTRIGLSGTNITNAVFEHLDRFPNLTSADLNGNRQVTTEAVIAFEQSHPKCDIKWHGNSRVKSK